MGGPPPGIQVQYGSVELDAYGQPLSPTNMMPFKGENATNPNQDSNNPQQALSKKYADHILTAAKGTPKMAGLTSYEYMPDNGEYPSGLSYFYNDVKAKKENIDETMMQKYSKYLLWINLFTFDFCSVFNWPVNHHFKREW